MPLTGVDVLEPVVKHVAGETCHLTGWLGQLVQGLHTIHTPISHSVVLRPATTSRR